MSLLAVGVSHQTAPVALLEQFAMGPDDRVKALHELVGSDHVTEALVFNPDGRIEQAFAAGTAGEEPQETKTFGAWTAGPGRAKDRCALSLVFEEGERRDVEVAALAATRILVDGQPFTRAR